MTDEQPTQSAGGTDEYAVAIAAFRDEDGAMVAYRALLDAEESGSLGVEGVLVLRTDEDAKISIVKMTDHSTRNGVKWGVAGGIVLGVIFPPSILASAATLGVLGGIVGKIRNESHRAAVDQAMSGVLGRLESGLLVLAKASDLDGVRAAMHEARMIRTSPVDAETAERIRGASAQAG